MSQGDSNAMARLGNAAAGAAGAEGAEGAAAVAVGLDEPAALAPVAPAADAAVVAADAAPFVEFIDASVDPAPEMPEGAAAAAEEAAIDTAVMAVADELHDFMEAERLAAAVQEGQAASLAEAARFPREHLEAEREWPTLVAAKQHPKRLRSTTPASKAGAAAPPSDPPAADEAPEDPSSGDLEGRDIPCPPSGQEILGEGQAADSPSVAQAEFEERVREIMAGGGDAPQAEPLPTPAARSVRFDGELTLGGAPMAPAPQQPGSANDPPPEQQPAGGGEAIPSKAMPRLLPARVAVRPSPYRDIRYVPRSCSAVPRVHRHF